MERADFLAKHPQLWHVADAGSWPMLRQHGLLSAARLVELFEHPDPERLLAHRRPAAVGVVAAPGAPWEVAR